MVVNFFSLFFIFIFFNVVGFCYFWYDVVVFYLRDYFGLVLWFIDSKKGFMGWIISINILQYVNFFWRLVVVFVLLIIGKSWIFWFQVEVKEDLYCECYCQYGNFLFDNIVEFGVGIDIKYMVEERLLFIIFMGYFFGCLWVCLIILLMVKWNYFESFIFNYI